MSELEPFLPVNGVCGEAHNVSSYDIPTIGLCFVGEASIVSGEGPWSWDCVGDTVANCFANKRVDGVCGDDHNIITLSSPVNTCNSGVFTSVSTDSNLALLMHMDGVNNGTVFYDQTGKIVTRYGDSKTVTGSKKFGLASAYFDGVDDYLSLGDASGFNFGSDLFTVDFWVNLPSVGTNYYGMIGNGDWYNYNGWTIGCSSSGQILFCANGSMACFDSVNPISANSWHHVAVVREGLGTNQTKMYIDGVLASQGTIPAINNPNLPFSIGRWGSNWNGGFYYLNGNLDEIRIAKGVTYWTSNFTPPNNSYYWWNWGCNGIEGGNDSVCGANRY
ncbi:MAG: hypothetical protein MNSN_09910 [Minisyncoccus archaeiphilus]|uniref:LamG domain-containing protein n=1 Tax=Minisyncoccus archaeiphilus TaxID=3238481 RepID=UPI002B0EBDFB|nr:MAG: hypothetical protein MNSN_09910 [Candidatus Parcubacteria bacterium]